MTKLKGCLIIAFAVLSAMAAAFFIGFKKTIAARASFSYDGFVYTDEANTDAPTVAAVSEGTTYRLLYPESVEFRSAQGMTSAPLNSFIHYDEGALSAFADGVIADLKNIADGTIDCYSISAGTVMTKNGDGYSPEGRDDALTMSDFIWKLSDDTYMICSGEIGFTLPDGTAKSFSQYAEIKYLSEGALCVTGAEGSFKCISSGLTASFGENCSFDALNKKISSGNGALDISALELNGENNAVIESVRRIPTYSVVGVNGKDGNTGALGEAGDGGETGSEGTQGDAGALGNSGASGSSGSDGQAGAVGTSGSTSAEQPDSVYMPIMKLTELRITSTAISGHISIMNEDALSPTEGQIKLYKYSSGEYTGGKNEPFYSMADKGVDFSFTQLEPECRYTLVVSADYSVTVNGTPVSGNADFISRDIYTDTIGIYPALVSASENTLRIGAQMDEWCIVKKAWIILSDEDGEEIGTKELDLSKLGTGVLFEGLTPDTAYTATLVTSFAEEGSSDEGRKSKNELICKTLKTMPTGIGEPVIAVNANGYFEVCLDGAISDPCSGIVRYIYEVCDLSNVVWKSVSNPVRDPIAIYTDELYIRVGTTYKVKVKVEFFDNEKINVYETDYSEEFVVYGDIAPKVSFSTLSVTDSLIAGNVVIDVSNITPVISDSYPIMIVIEAPGYYYYTQNVNNAVAVGGTVTIPIRVDIGLKPETSYRFTVSGYADYYGEGNAQRSEWGSFIVATKSK